MLKVFTIAIYLCCGLAALVLVVWSHRKPDQLTSLGSLVDEIMVSPAARIGLVAFWWWLGWHFLFAQTVDG